MRTRKRSKKASPTSSSGMALVAPTTETSGQGSRRGPLSNSRSLRRVRSALRMALFALKTSSTKAMEARGRKPAVCRS